LEGQTIGGDRVIPERADTAPHFPVGPCGAPRGAQVPYQTKAERERARWMTLTETLKHISESEACDQTAAVKELRTVLTDGLFIKSEIRWADPVARPFGDSGGLAIPDDTPAWVDWNKASFRLKGDGAILDKWSGYRLTKKHNPRWRKLLLLREKVEKQWPLSTQSLPPSETTTQSGSKVVRFISGKRRGPTYTKSKIEEVAKRLIERGRNPTTCGGWEKFRREVCLEAKVAPNARGYQLDTVQNAVRPFLKPHNSNTEKTESTES
jgi:hypothetical protein